MKTLSEIRSSEAYEKKMVSIKSEADCKEITWDQVREIAEDYAYRCWKSGEELSAEKLTRALVYYDYIANQSL